MRCKRVAAAAISGSSRGRFLGATVARVRNRIAATSATAAADGVSIPAELVAALIDAARKGAPHEACGLLVADRYWAAGGVPSRYLPLHNAAESAYRYAIDPDEQLRVWMELDAADEVVWAIFHSHVAYEARPSATDVDLAYYPDSLHLICSLADPDSPVVRGWSIREGSALEVNLLVTG